VATCKLYLKYLVMVRIRDDRK